MLKKCILACLAILAISCAKENKFTITASLDGVEDGRKVYLNAIDGDKLAIKDTAIVANGKFSFTGNVDSPDVYFLSIDNIRYNLPFILENDDINLTIYKDSVGSSTIEGTKENELLKQYTQKVNEISKEITALGKENREAQKAKDTAWMNSLKSEYQDLVNKGMDYDMQFIKDNSKSLMGLLVLERKVRGRDINAKELKEVFDNFPEDLKQTRAGKTTSDILDAAIVTSIGSIAPDFSAPTPEGNMMALKDARGKVTVLDFWAAWCAPCRRENPNLVKVYNMYHDKGLEIIGVSLDGNGRQKDPKEAWLKAIEDDSLTWHQVSNLQYFNGPVAKAYNIKSIPASFILDAEGKIVAKNLRGKELEDKIAELLK